MMTEEQLQELAKNWIAYCYSRERDKAANPLGNFSAESSRLFAASEQISELTLRRPEEAWRVILAIHEQDHSLTIRTKLAAGPIEDLLSRHGERWIVRVEEEADRSAAFRSTLGGVWQNQIADPVWERVQKVWDRSGWDSLPGEMKD